MLSIYKNDPKDKFLNTTTENLYYSVLLLDGYLPDPNKMIANIQELLSESSELYVKK